MQRPRVDGGAWMQSSLNQKLNINCRSMVLLAAGDEKNPPASALDFPNMGDSSTPTGCARFTVLKTFLAMAAKVSE